MRSGPKLYGVPHYHSTQRILTLNTYKLKFMVYTRLKFGFLFLYRIIPINIMF